MQLIDRLMSVGLGRHEAELYVLLHREGPMTGYEAAKHSGISRSNAYPALSSLAEKGAAWIIAGDVQKYMAVPAEDFCRSKKRQFNELLDWIEQNMPLHKQSAEPFVTITGRDNILNQVRNLINQAKLRVYAALDSELTDELLNELTAAVERDLKVVLITENRPDINGLIYYQGQRKPGQIRLITDSEQVMTGELSADSEPMCLFSKNQALVTLFKEAMMNEMALLELTGKSRKTDQEREKI
ncbi:MAG: helix-turn-helix domain-containing protein [Eubacteriales bacterium]|nr:helix-turn-helix domain-containing protein [Eubacteriales bacterium]